MTNNLVRANFVGTPYIIQEQPADKVIEFKRPANPNAPKIKNARGADDPIRSIEDIWRIKECLLTSNSYGNTNLRNCAYFMLGIYTSRRAGDILQMKIGDVIDADGNFKIHSIFEREQKTGIKTKQLFSDDTKEILRQYLDSMKDYTLDDYLFPSDMYENKPMTVGGMRRTLQRKIDKLNLGIHFGTHTLRKTLPYLLVIRFKKSDGDISKDLLERVSQYLGHKDIETTRHYLTCDQDDFDDLVTTFYEEVMKVGQSMEASQSM